MQCGVHPDAVVLDQLPACLKISLALDALHLGQEAGKELAQTGVVMYDDKGLPVALFEFDHVLASALLIRPAGYQLAVTHVRLFHVLPRFDAHKLGHQTVHHIMVVSCLVGIGRREKAEFDHLRVCHIVKSEEVGARFLQRGAIGAQGIGVHPREELAGAVPKAFVEVRMQIVGLKAILLRLFDFLLAPHELLGEAAALRGFVVSLSDILDGNGLGTVVAANPVGVREVDANRSRGIAVATEHGNCDDFSAHALHLGFAEAGVYGRMILEPLGVRADDAGAFRRPLVDEVDGRFPACLAAEWVAVGFNEAVHEVHVRGGVFYPEDGVGIERLEVARLVIFDKLFYDGLLRLVLREGESLLELGDNPFYGLRIKSAYLPDLLEDPAIDLCKPAVQSVGDGAKGVLTRLHLGVEGVHLGLRQVSLVVVVGRSLNQVHVSTLDGAFREDRRVEDDRRKLGEQLVYGLSFAEGELRRLYLSDTVSKELLRERGENLILGVVVVNAVGEPDSLEVCLQRLELLILPIALVRRVHRFQRAADRKVIATVLVCQDIAPHQSRLGEVIKQLLLPEAQLLEAGHLITEDLQVCELVHYVVEGSLAALCLRGRLVAASSHTYCCHN